MFTEDCNFILLRGILHTMKNNTLKISTLLRQHRCAPLRNFVYKNTHKVNTKYENQKQKQYQTNGTNFSKTQKTGDHQFAAVEAMNITVNVNTTPVTKFSLSTIIHINAKPRHRSRRMYWLTYRNNL